MRDFMRRVRDGIRERGVRKKLKLTTFGRRNLNSQSSVL